MAANDDPLVAPPPPEVPLKDAPLVRVIAQVRFPLVIALERREFVASFQEALRARYPVLRQEPGGVLAPAGGASALVQTVWRFADISGDWRVSLAPDFLALETTAYSSRSDFLTRLREVVAVLDERAEPKLVDRLGVRYIDRISGPAVDEIAQLVRPEVRGIAGTPVAAHALHALSETLFVLEKARMVARWGRVPPEATVDAAAIEPISEPSWILDIDMFSTESTPFAVDGVIDSAESFSERIYTLFRWVVTPAFLRRYGGNP
jgi:uncharacterized protein (TIGR04255 family)